MSVLWTNVPEPVAKFQLGHAYACRLGIGLSRVHRRPNGIGAITATNSPLSGTNETFSTCCYGTPPMFMFERKPLDGAEIALRQSYKNTCPYIRQSGYSEMLDHRFLTPDRFGPTDLVWQRPNRHRQFWLASLPSARWLKVGRYGLFREPPALS